MSYNANQVMEYLEQASRPLGIVFGAGNVLGWNLAAKSLFRLQADVALLTHQDWLQACRRTVRTSEEQKLDLLGFQFRLCCLKSLNNNGKFLQGAYATEMVLVEVLQNPVTTETYLKSTLKREMTKSEIAILHELASGAEIEEIAVRRGSKPSTIRQHLKNIQRKLGITRRPALVQFALKHQI